MNKNNKNQSFARGLKVLRLLSTVDGRSCNEIARELNLPRATCHRLVKTLEAEGYAKLYPSDNRYRLDEEARYFGKGYDPESWVPDIAEPLLRSFTKKHLWPVAVSTLHGVEMKTRATTDAISPFSLSHFRRGYLMTLTGSAPGLVYLAFCEEKIRSKLIACLSPDSYNHASMRSNKALMKKIEQIRAQRFAFAPTRFSGEHAYAMPVFVKKKLHSALSIRYIVKAKMPDQILLETQKPLAKLAATLSKRLSSQ